MKNYECILRAISETVWALHPPKMDEVVAVLEARMNGVVLETAHFKELQARREAHLGTQNRVAVLGLHGIMSQKVGLLTGSGGASTEEFGQHFDAAMNDPQVDAVVVDIDSPGGSVFGLRELADKIHGRRGQKRTIGVVNPEAYSAAYYVGSAFDELVATPSAMAGSIGTMAAHVDRSAMDEKLGLKVTYIHAGDYKVEGNPHEPLSDEAKAQEQKIVDHYYRDFVDAVARHRGVSAATVEDRFGQGRVFPAAEARERGMIDRIATLEEVVGEMRDTRRATAKRSAERLRRKMLLT